MRGAAQQFRRRKKNLPTAVAHEIEEALFALQQAISEKNVTEAHDRSLRVDTLTKIHLRKTFFDQCKDLTFALAFALCVAVLIRQMWFEFYEIPTGSMRPTLKEKDRLVVSKTMFGVNLPLTTQHLYFDQALVQRGGIFIFTGENMDIRDVDTLYFYLFPGKKQYVKRVMGKPGDTLYFYGGKIYGIDQDGHDISQELQKPELKQIEHIPFIHFEGKVKTSKIPSSGGVYSPVFLLQMNETVARLDSASGNQVHGELTNLLSASAYGIPAYGDLWGMKNFAMARLLTREQVEQLTDHKLFDLEEGILYLELKHSPSLAAAKIGRDEMGRMRPLLGTSSSIIPLKEKQLHALFENLYTMRFVIKNGFALRYGTEHSYVGKSPFIPHFPGVPDGCYEFYYGKAYKVKWEGITEELPKNHPLYQFDVHRLQLLFNVGIEFDMHYSPQIKNQRLFPSRYAYFRSGDLYLMGAPILSKEDPALLQFVNREMGKQSETHGPQNSYQPFVDAGPPLKEDGTLDRELIRTFGLTVPENMYLALGDNHAMSSDSRDFGFVPQGNMRGAPDWIFWPPGKRWGAPNQPPYPFFNLPRTLVWAAAAACIGIGWSWHRRHGLRERTKRT